MAAIAYLDTHVVVRLYATGTTDLPKGAFSQLQLSELLKISPMVRLELQYLWEIGRVKQAPASTLDYLSTHLGLQVCDMTFASAIHAAQSENWTRDPFDRLIVAQARLSQATLLTRDRLIHQHYPLAVW